MIANPQAATCLSYNISSTAVALSSLPTNADMVLTRSQSAERDRLRTQSHEPRSEGGTETTQSCLLQQEEEEDQEPQPEFSHPDPSPEET